jgi:hypothetical protein
MMIVLIAIQETVSTDLQEQQMNVAHVKHAIQLEATVQV